MTRFLGGSDVGAAIREVIAGGDLQCAVAFWGSGAVRSLFPDRRVPAGVRIVCDVSMGGTNPRELEELGAPRNTGLAHLPGLHAKVYISDRGVVIGSANASNNGIGFLTAAPLTEAGTFHDVGSDVHRHAAEWFDDVWRRSTMIGPDELDLAKDAWRRGRAGAGSGLSRQPLPGSLLDAVRADPAAFRGIGFVFTSGTSTAEHRSEGSDALLEQDDELEVPLLSRQTRRALRGWPLGDLFSNWSAEDISAWPLRFVCVHEGARGRIGYWFYERTHPVLVDKDRGMVFATRPRGLRRELGFRHGRDAMAAVDMDRLRDIFPRLDEHGHRLFESGERFARFLGDLDAEDSA